MRNQPASNFSPKGLGRNNAVVAPDPRPYLPVQSHRHTDFYPGCNAEDAGHDDGLVHGHFWAMSSTVR